jgi:hypothetical protein
MLVKVPPEPDTADDMTEYLNLTYKTHSDDMLEATQESDQIAARLAKAQRKHWDEQAKIEGNAMRALIGGKAGIRGKDWVYTWKQMRSGGMEGFSGEQAADRSRAQAV